MKTYLDNILGLSVFLTELSQVDSTQRLWFLLIIDLGSRVNCGVVLFDSWVIVGYDELHEMFEGKGKEIGVLRKDWIDKMSDRCYKDEFNKCL